MRDLISGLVRGYAEGMDRNREQLQSEELKKLQIKLFKHDLDQKEQTQNALGQLTKALSTGAMPSQLEGTSLADGLQGPTRPAPPSKPMSLTDLLANPEGQGLALQAGMKPTEIRHFQQPNVLELLQKLGVTPNTSAPTPGAIGAPPNASPGPGGLDFTGLKLGPDGQLMPDFSKAKYKTEVDSPDGKSKIQLDEYGRVIGQRLLAPAEIKPPEQTKGQNAVDTEFAKDYAEFKAAGGYTDVQKGLSQLKGASAALEKGGITGPFKGNTPDAIRAFTNPDALAVRDAVHEVVQRNMKLVLGAQFTQKEGEMLMARAFNERLSDAENKKRVDRLMQQMQTAALAKQEAANYFEKNGTLTGFKGKLWTAADFLQNEKPSLNLNKKNKVVDFNDL